MTCTCGHISIGSTTTELRNWNPDCEEHGVGSDWYNDPKQIARREQQRQRTIDLQRQAAEARRN